MDNRSAVLEPPLDLNAPRPCIGCDAICYACGSPVLAGVRYCTACTLEIDRPNLNKLAERFAREWRAEIEAERRQAA
jgi:predicted amidophosphoribosyltransferase